MAKNILKPIDNLMKESIRGILFSQETAEKLKDSFLKLSKLKGFESLLEIMKILNELATAENKTLLSSYSIEAEMFAENDKMKVIHDYTHKNFDQKLR